MLHSRFPKMLLEIIITLIQTFKKKVNIDINKKGYISQNPKTLTSKNTSNSIQNKNENSQLQKTDNNINKMDICGQNEDTKKENETREFLQDNSSCFNVTESNAQMKIDNLEQKDIKDNNLVTEEKTPLFLIDTINNNEKKAENNVYDINQVNNL